LDRPRQFRFWYVRKIFPKYNIIILGCLSVGVPNRRDKKSSVSSVVLQNSQNATQMAARLSKLLQVQVFIGGNLGDESETAWRLVETRIKEEQMTNTTLFSF